ncbi:response regulator [Leadbettera azotonutricia]|uniref:Two-component response regulator YesN n=1 Tax=Leadbettera azotonutricia (strain ATCC BAA-888 / DSM 13862 / ZAS-9) TaxID=545695 RepID=F5YEJ6_LEAAZ|nr:response regulator [Leadbettera azotonutricia]AEF83417.1 two-component response regulator YesN [Leadbettera azotonutricia ZAS-9]
MRVLILDDESNIVKGLSFMINKFNLPHCEIFPMTNQEEALVLYQEKPADIILVDISMPGMSGLQFIEKALQIAPCRFVVLSGYSDFNYAQQAIHLGVKEYLIKPVDENDLNRILSEVFKELYHIAPEDFIDISSLAQFNDAYNSEIGRQKFSKHMQEIINYINDNLGGDVSITRLGDITGLNPNYISSLFIKEMNIGLHKYVESLRLMKAMQMLKEDGNVTMGKIATALGYFNERQFFRMFKKYTGKSPGEFRNSE